MKRKYDVTVIGGGVAGAVSVISAKHSIAPSETSFAEIRTLLIKHNAIVPEYVTRDNS